MTDKEILDAMRSMLEPIQADIGEMKADMTEMKADMRQLNQRMTLMESKTLHGLDAIRERITGWNERNQQIDKVQSKVEEHDDRIWALEQKAQ